MTATTFDTLAYVERLTSAGVPPEQAKAQVRILAEIVESNLATKQDILDLRRDMKEMEQRITIRLGAMMAGSIAAIAALVKLL